MKKLYQREITKTNDSILINVLPIQAASTTGSAYPKHSSTYITITIPVKVIRTHIQILSNIIQFNF